MHRGDICAATIDFEIKEVLPSFLTSLQIASVQIGLAGTSGLSYVHDFAVQNTIAWKLEYELNLKDQRTQSKGL